MDSADLSRDKKLAELLEAAIDQPTAERRAFLEARCDDESLVDEVVTLLNTEVSGTFLSSPFADTKPGTPAAVRKETGSGMSIGPYELEEVIGEGGMGRVYVASQHEPVHRRVAVKLMRSSLVGSGARARFDVERQALARLGHPNIAQMFEAGATPDGYLYFAMELVDGVAITKYCDRKGASIRRRLEIFMDVCRAVEHAHQRQLLHRDLKPSNVLVTEVDGQPVPKVIDFGVAKTLDRPTEATLIAGDRVVGTPAYMSPEALLADEEGVDVDTRTDVYALGVMLYELLSGARPFEPTKADGSLTEVWRQILEDDPKRPSRQLTAAAEKADEIAGVRGLRLPELRRCLEGDLDWIVLKAIAKQREDRYGSAAELARDIERHLANRPVDAGPRSTSYLVRRFVRRHRAAVVSALLLLLTLAAGIVGTTSGLFRARSEAESARRAQAEADEVAEFLVTLFAEIDPLDYSNADVPRRTEVRAIDLLRRGAVRARQELDDQPRLRARLLDTLGRVHSSLGALDEARPLLEEAVGLYQQLDDSDPAQVAASHRNLGRLLENLTEYEEAERHYRRALETARAAFGESHPESIESLRFLAKLQLTVGRRAAARPMLEKTLRLAQATYGRDHVVVADTLNALAWLSYSTGEYEEAERRFRGAVEMDLRILGPDNPNTAILQNNHAWTLVLLGRLTEGEKVIEAVLSTMRRALPADHWRIANAESVLGAVRARQGRCEEAERLLLESYPVVREKTGERSPYTRVLLERLIDLYERWDRPADAERYRELWRGAGGSDR